MTLADELRSKLPIVVTKNVEVEEEKPRPLNKEALEVILQLALDASEEGYGSMRIFLDGNYEEWGLLDKPTLYYEESEVIRLLKSPELGFEIEEDDAGDGTRLRIIWSNNHPHLNSITIEVSPPKEYYPYLMNIKEKGVSWKYWTVWGLLSSLLEEFNSLKGDEIDSFESFLSLKGFSSEAITFLTSQVDDMLWLHTFP